MNQLKLTVLRLLALCTLCAITAFCFPGLPGAVLSGVTIALAGIVGVLCIGGLVYMLIARRFSVAS